ncbi:hypothetical protein MATL_G00251550 [Megalops atlanticus]|uniref:Uncharacterized protein n=1 Tax=Megalops atlanticus TaxID=7932 RepID=A0A9D3PDL4_MEGAT|nr:hypothetical protein MATL_G00251550 [Megalops atlanticus]
MEILGKAAVAEISRRVRLEMSQSQREIEALKRKLHLLEREIIRTRRKKAERVFGQEWSFGVWRDAETTAVEEESTPLQSVMREESADMEENTPESLLIKEERLEDNVWSRDPQPTPAEEQVAQPTPAEHPKKHVTQHTPGEEQVTQLTPAADPEEQVAESIPPEEKETQLSHSEGPVEQVTQTPAGDPEELGEKHRCGHSEEDLSGLEFVVKAEQEEEHNLLLPNHKSVC